jgi:hypothetical protein
MSSFARASILKEIEARKESMSPEAYDALRRTVSEQFKKVHLIVPQGFEEDMGNGGIMKVNIELDEFTAIVPVDKLNGISEGTFVDAVTFKGEIPVTTTLDGSSFLEVKRVFVSKISEVE